MSNFYLILYLLAWFITLFIYQRKHRQVDAGSIILISYVLYAICSIILYNTNNEYHSYGELTFFPYLYLYTMLIVALKPVLNFNNQECAINTPNMTIIKIVSWIIILSTILSIPTYISQIQNGSFLLLFADDSVGKDMYKETMANAEESGLSITHLPNIIFNSLSDITIFLFFYGLTFKKHDILIMIGLALALVAALISPMLGGLRTSTTITAFTILMTYFLFRRYYSSRIKKVAKLGSIILIIITILPIAAITLSRFGDKDGGAKSSVLYYIGQANLNFNNYGLDNNGIRYGDRTFNLVKRLIDPSTPANFIERRDKYPHLYIDDYVFYTFIGDFTLDFGPLVASIIIILFSMYVSSKTKPTENIIELHQLLLIYIVACICMQGGMYLFSYSDTAGLKLVTFFLLYVSLKLSKFQLRY